jgi:hypothetical protein
MVDPGRPARISRGRVLALLVAGVFSGCAVVPGSRLDESQRLVHSLRAENARLKDQVLGLQAQNRDYADRALDDLRRLTARDQAIDRLERSVQAYQDDRDRLAAAYRRLAVGLGRQPEDISSGTMAEPRDVSVARRSARRADGADDHGSERLSSQGDEGADGSPARPTPAGSGP